MYDEYLLAEVATAGAPYAELVAPPAADADLAAAAATTEAPATQDRALRVAYGENELGLRNIQLASGSVTVRGNATDFLGAPNSAVLRAGDGAFISEEPQVVLLANEGAPGERAFNEAFAAWGE